VAVTAAAEVDPLHEVMTAAQRAFIAAPDTVVRDRADWFQIITPSAGRAGLNEVSRSILADDAADAIIDATLAEYRGRGLRFRWRIDATSRPLDLAARLEARGLVCHPGVGVVRRTDGVAPPLPPGLTIEEITAERPERIDVFSQTMALGWELPVAQVAGYQRFAMADPAQRQRYVVAHLDGVPAGAAGMFLLERSVMLQGGVVLPAYRRRGVYAAMVHARLALAARLGRGLAISHARGDTSAPILAALGFDTVAHFRSYSDP
jgi:GNAT superfamily N-acetyltransferase